MPGRNLIRFDSDKSFYHVYNRGVNKQLVFLDQNDYAVFLNLLKRYLGASPIKDNKGRNYPWFGDEVELLCFCLMPNHFHLLLYQEQKGAVSKLLQALTTSYGMYFNKRYKRVGPVFQGKFRASWVTGDSYFEHISRYIHLNPANYKTWEWSSLPYFLGSKQADWIKPATIMNNFTTRQYRQFLDDYRAHTESLQEIKYVLADQ